jgi:hypothetical protein
MESIQYVAMKVLYSYQTSIECCKRFLWRVFYVPMPLYVYKVLVYTSENDKDVKDVPKDTEENVVIEATHEDIQEEDVEEEEEEDIEEDVVEDTQEDIEEYVLEDTQQDIEEYVLEDTREDIQEDVVCVDDVTTKYIQGDNLIHPNNCLDRIEYRILWKHRYYYRLVSTPTHIIEPTHNQFAGGQKISSRPKVICARLKNDSEGTNEDVIHRVLKYAGPRHDFFNQPILMKWLFENDSLLEDTELHIMLNNCKFFVFKPNEIMRIKE